MSELAMARVATLEATDTSRAQTILREASFGRCRLLSRNGFHVIEPAETNQDISRLMDLLVEAEKKLLSARAEGIEILPLERGRDFGHAPSWIDVGFIYEQLVRNASTDTSPEYVFCLDPWTASFVTTKPKCLQHSKWVFISDLHSRQSGVHAEYWKQMDRWFEGLGFHAIVSKAVWDQILAEAQADPPQAGPRCFERIHRSSPGAWQWLALSASLPTKRIAECTITFVVRSSGGLTYFRTLWDSICRQDYNLSKLSMVVLARNGDPDLSAYLKWAAIANTEINVRTLDVAQMGWSASFDYGPQRDSDYFAILSSDRIILAPSTSKRLAQTIGSSSIPAASVDLSASAHIITGNLDPIAHYEKLLEAFVNASPLVEGVKIIPRTSLNLEGGNLVEQVLNLAEGQPLESMGLLDSRGGARPLMLLKLGEAK